MTMRSKSEPPKVSIFHEQNQADTTTPRGEPEVPTMTNDSVLGPPPPRPRNAPPEELAEDIVAKPLSMPEFAANVQPYLVNQNLAARWIFTDRRRYSQARAQGFRNCTKQDLKPSFALLSPFEEEGGTKFINGDLILMLIDRKRYLGALKYKHDFAYRLSEAGTAKRVSAQRARQEMGAELERLNRQRAQSGYAPLMQVFDPDKTDLEQVGVPVGEVNRLGHQGRPDTGKVSDLNRNKEE